MSSKKTLGAEEVARIRSLISKKRYLIFNLVHDDHAVEELLSKAEKIQVQKGEILTEEGSSSKDFFIVAQGKFLVNVSRFGLNGISIRTLEPGSYFGDLAIVYDLPRAATVTADEESIVYKIPAADILQFIQHYPEVEDVIHAKRWIRKVIESHVLFRHVDDDALREGLVRAFKLKSYDSDEIIFEQGSFGDRFFVVMEGQCDVLVEKDGKSQLVTRLFPGDSFGEVALLYNEKRTATIRSSGKSLLYYLDKETFKTITNHRCLNFRNIFDQYSRISPENGQKIMTVDDFMNAVTSADGQNIHGSVDTKALKLIFEIADADQSQTISFSEFVLLGMLLQKPNPEFEVAFRFFDQDKDGKIGAQEFQTAIKAIIQAETGSTSFTFDPVLMETIFGPKLDQMLSHEEFVVLLQTGKLPEIVNFWKKITKKMIGVSERWIGQIVTVDDSDNLVVHGNSGKPRQHWKYLFAGGVAGAVSRTAVAPLIRLKLLLQTQGVPPKYVGLFHGMRTMFREDGFRGLFRGNGSNVIRIAPTVALQFFFFETFKNFMVADTKRDLTVTERLLGGGFSGLAAATLTYPLDFIRARLTIQVGSQSSVAYSGIVDGLYQVFQKEGWRGWYRGWVPTAWGVFPYIGIDFAVYETLKPFAPKNERGETSIVGILAVGGVAGLVSQTVAFPLETIRRRLQVQGFVRSEYQYEGTVLNTFRMVIQKEGIRGLYRGLVPNYVKAVPTIGIGFAVYERMKTLLSIQ